jgi:hypothetical protein
MLGDARTNRPGVFVDDQDKNVRFLKPGRTAAGNGG